MTDAGDPTASRRAVLATGVLGAATALAGCSATGGGPLETFDGAVDVDPTLARDGPSWPVVHGDPANTRAVSASVAPEPPLSLEWSYDYETHVGHVHPVGRDGAVVGSNLVDDVFAVDAGSGRHDWRITDDQILEAEFEPRTNPVVTDDAVLIGTRSRLWSFDQEDGNVRWNADESIDLGVLRSGPTADDRSAFVGTTVGVAAHDLESGEREWERSIGLRLGGVPAVRDDAVYLGGNDATLHALERESGDVRWRRNADGAIEAGPAVTASGIYVGTAAGTVIAYDFDGTERWRTAVDGAVETLAAGNGIICATTDDALAVLDPETGDRAWRSTRYLDTVAAGVAICGRWLFATIEDTSEGVHVGHAGRVGAFDAETGRLEWESDESGFVAGPAVIDGALYLTGRLGDPSAVVKLA
ncbi:outer membrane protein assembly factor BamB family protein [Halopiger goleimassiliensis]|uniref:outer membrane protein assembly factor BamB family protein n=1 Tax=Halopiger goleimassiliensis TaxID=1293048 RepID=UPI0006777B9D|nr:PQQ-binding-like beta-propeller repeat protein [Halopiger goleimassiliensis]